MGCDIHMYIHYKPKDQTQDFWYGFGGRINPGRNYAMFGILSTGVRWNAPKSFEPKGLPNHDLSWECRDDLYLRITETGDGDRETTLENALRWKRPMINDHEGKPYLVQHPDWHSHSWLTISELKQAYALYKKFDDEKWGVGVEYKAILGAMKALENKGRNDVIVVFWFDN